MVVHSVVYLFKEGNIGTGKACKPLKTYAYSTVVYKALVLAGLPVSVHCLGRVLFRVWEWRTKGEHRPCPRWVTVLLSPCVCQWACLMRVTSRSSRAWPWGPHVDEHGAGSSPARPQHAHSTILCPFIIIPFFFSCAHVLRVTAERLSRTTVHELHLPPLVPGNRR